MDPKTLSAKPRQAGTEMEKSSIEAAAKECFVGRNTVSASLFIKALQKRNVVTRNNLTRIIESTDYLALAKNNNAVVLTKDTFVEKAVHPPPPPSRKISEKAFENRAAPPPVEKSAVFQVTNTAKVVPPVAVNCDTQAIADILGDIAIEMPDLGDVAMTDIFIDVGSNASVKINTQCVQHNRVIAHDSAGVGPTAKQDSPVIFGQTVHRLAKVMYDSATTGVTNKVGRSVSCV